MLSVSRRYLEYVNDCRLKNRLKFSFGCGDLVRRVAFNEGKLNVMSKYWYKESKRLKKKDFVHLSLLDLKVLKKKVNLKDDRNRYLEEVLKIPVRYHGVWAGLAEDYDVVLEGKEVRVKKEKDLYKEFFGEMGDGYRINLYRRKVRFSQSLTEKIDIEKLNRVRSNVSLGLTSTDLLLGEYLNSINHLKEKNYTLKCSKVLNEELLKLEEELKKKEEQISKYTRELYIETNLNYSERIYYEVETILKIVNIDDLGKTKISGVIKPVDLMGLNLVNVSRFKSSLSLSSFWYSMKELDLRIKYGSIGSDGVYCLQDLFYYRLKGGLWLNLFLRYRRVLGEKSLYEDVEYLRLENRLNILKLDKYLSNLEGRFNYKQNVDYSYMEDPYVGKCSIFLKRLVLYFEFFQLDMLDNYFREFYPIDLDDFRGEAEFVGEETDIVTYNLNEMDQLDHYLDSSYNIYFDCVSKLGDYYSSVDFISLKDLWSDKNLEEKYYEKVSKNYIFKYEISGSRDKSLKEGLLDIRNIILRLCGYLGRFVVSKYSESKEIVEEILKYLEKIFDDQRKKEGFLYPNYRRYVWYELLKHEYTELGDVSVEEILRISREECRDDLIELGNDNAVNSFYSEIGDLHTVTEEEEEEVWLDDVEKFDVYEEFVTDSIDTRELGEIFELEYKIDEIFILPESVFIEE